MSLIFSMHSESYCYNIIGICCYNFYNLLHHCLYLIDGCEKSDCPKSATCVPTQEGSTKCVCKECSYLYTPVCGSDGVPYASDCELNREACLSNKELTIIDSDACGMFLHLLFFILFS